MILVVGTHYFKVCIIINKKTKQFRYRFQCPFKIRLLLGIRVLCTRLLLPISYLLTEILFVILFK